MACAWTASYGLEIVGVTVTPHVVAESMPYRRDPEPAVGARVQLILRNNGDSSEPLVFDSSARLLFNNKVPGELLASGDWAWHDIPGATEEILAMPPKALAVWTLNSRKAPFGPGSTVAVKVGPENGACLSGNVKLETIGTWLSAVTFLGPVDAINPDTIIVHVANDSDTALEIEACRLWLPRDPKTPRILDSKVDLDDLQGSNGCVTIPAHDRGGFVVKTSPLPLTYAAVEVVVKRLGDTPFALWTHLRVKPERFDIAGGWVTENHNSVTSEIFLKALKRLHVNTAYLGLTPGYSDTPLYARYPLKYLGPLIALQIYDTDALLPRIHAIECLGEPQYGGGRPVPPQEVWEQLRPFSTSRLATTLTHSEERVWRDYAGLSDFPHYDAYRVGAPSADAWRKYERWGDVRIGWGAPLETIGDMCRSLRELNRPMPCAIWSQGPHTGWDVHDGRERTSPTSDEIRMQAYHAISTRITSLYWFNLRLDSMIQWRDTLDELGRIGRELRVLDELLLEGDAYRFERRTGTEGKLDWDLASVCGPRAGLLFALDLDYTPDPDEKVFRFGPPRAAQWSFPLPHYLSGARDVFRLDADGIGDVDWSREGNAIVIRGRENKVAVYVATPDKGLRTHLESERRRLIEEERALQFDPAHDDADFARLVQLASEDGREGAM